MIRLSFQRLEQNSRFNSWKREKIQLRTSEILLGYQLAKLYGYDDKKNLAKKFFQYYENYSMINPE